MELQEVIEKRGSIRKYKAGSIPDKDIKEIIKAAGLAPSGKNMQNWHFVVIKDKKKMEDIADIVVAKNNIIAKDMDKADRKKADRFRGFCKNFTLFFTDAAVLTVVYSAFYAPSGYDEYKLTGRDPDKDLILLRNPGMQSLGAALENFSLKTADLGYGSCWMTSANYAAEEIAAYIKKETGFEKEGYFIAALMSMGIPAGDQKSPSRKDPEDIYTFV